MLLYNKMVTCVAYGCTNRTSKKIPGITFHCFPKNEAQKQLWIKAVGRENWYPTHNSRLCSKHFPEHMMDRTSLSIVRLRENACPTIFETFPLYFEGAYNSWKTPNECIPKNSPSVNVLEENNYSSQIYASSLESESNCYVKGNARKQCKRKSLPQDRYIFASQGQDKLSQMEMVPSLSTNCSYTSVSVRLKRPDKNRSLGKDILISEVGKGKSKRSKRKCLLTHRKVTVCINDREDIFGKLVACEMRALSMNLPLYEHAKQKILEVLSDANLRHGE